MDSREWTEFKSLHFLRFQPLYKLTHLPPTPESTLDKARQIALEAGMKYVYIGNIPGQRSSKYLLPQMQKNTH